MDFNGEMSDDCPPIFNQFKAFFEEQRRNWFENSEKHRTEQFEHFAFIANENEKLKYEFYKTSCQKQETFFSKQRRLKMKKLKNWKLSITMQQKSSKN